MNEVSGKDFSAFFNDYVYTAADYEIPLLPCFGYLGITFSKQPSPQISEHLFGFKCIDNGVYSKVSLVAPYSSAWKAGLFQGDDILSVNGYMLKNNLNHWLQYFKDEEQITLVVNSAEQMKTLYLQKDKKGNTWFFQPQLQLSENATTEQKAAFHFWSQL